MSFLLGNLRRRYDAWLRPSSMGEVSLFDNPMEVEKDLSVVEPARALLLYRQHTLMRRELDVLMRTSDSRTKHSDRIATMRERHALISRELWPFLEAAGIGITA
jgi:hypothetical protein